MSREDEAMTEAEVQIRKFMADINTDEVPIVKSMSTLMLYRIARMMVRKGWVK